MSGSSGPLVLDQGQLDVNTLGVPSADTKDVANYLALITPYHSDKPKFRALLAALLQPLIDAQNLLRAIPEAFDLDTAIGVQLDAVGQWIGRTRFVDTPLPIYFSFDIAGLGFDAGVWKGPFDPTAGLTALDDTTYRSLLYAKVAANHWDGTLAGAVAALRALLGNNASTYAFVQDTLGMEVIYGISGAIPNSIMLSLFQNGYVPVRPEGVRAVNMVVTVDGSAMFGFDMNTNTIAGFNQASWGSGTGVVVGAQSMTLDQGTLNVNALG